MVVDLPQSKSLALLPELRDPLTIDAAVAKIFGAIQRKEASLVGYPVVHTYDGLRASTEACREERYPTEFEPPQLPQIFGGPPDWIDVICPTAFETRNVGVSLEVEPHIFENGNWIRLNLVPRRVMLLGYDNSVAGMRMPRFAKSETNTSVMIRNGQRFLVSFHKVPEAEENIELVIVQAWATPVK